MTRYLFRTLFIVSSLIIIAWVWQLQQQTTAVYYNDYTQQLGQRLSTIAAGSLTPWLNQTLISEQPDFREQLDNTLSIYLTLGHFRGIAVFNRFGVELGNVGQVDNIVTFVDEHPIDYSVFVAPIKVDDVTTGYIRFVVDDDIMANQQVQLHKQQQGMFLLTLLLGIIVGGFLVRLYYRKARRAFTQ